MIRFRKVLILSVLTGAVAAILASGCKDTSPADMDASDEYVTKVTTVEQFTDLVLNAKKPVLVDFYATWCGPCKLLAPRIHKLAGEFEGRAVFVKVNGDHSPDLANKYGVKAYPTVAVFSGGKVSDVLVGLRGAGDYRAALDKAIATPN